MKLSKFIKICKEKYPDNDDPDIMLFDSVNANLFCDIVLMSRNDYHDVSLYGKNLPSGQFIVIEEQY